MGIEWIVFGAVWLAMAGFVYRAFTCSGELHGNTIGLIATLLISLAVAPFAFGIALHLVLE